MPNSDRSAQLESLRSQHHELEVRLAELEGHLYLSPDEQRERAEIKKTKLALKDTILHLSRAG